MNLSFILIVAISAISIHCCSCSSESDSKVKSTSDIQGFRVGYSEMDNAKRSEELHPEVKKAVQNLSNSNRGNVPEIVVRKPKKSGESSK